jgi:molybdate transport system substrate-binding protein
MALYKIALSILMLLIPVGMAAAAEIRVLSVGSTQFAAKALAAEFAKESGHQVAFTIVAPFQVDERLAAEPYDVLIIAVPPMQALDTAGSLRPGSRTAIARVGIGLVVKDGASLPDISTPEAFKKTLLAARSVTYSDPAVPNLAGTVAAAVLVKAGIFDQVKSKARLAMLGPGAELITKGEVEMGFFNLSEVLPGLKIVGPPPAPLQGYTFYEAAVPAKAAAPAEAMAFIRLLASTNAGDKWRAAGLEPVAAYQSAKSP